MTTAAKEASDFALGGRARKECTDNNDNHNRNECNERGREKDENKTQSGGRGREFDIWVLRHIMWHLVQACCQDVTGRAVSDEHYCPALPFDYGVEGDHLGETTAPDLGLGQTPYSLFLIFLLQRRGDWTRR